MQLDELQQELRLRQQRLSADQGKRDLLESQVASYAAQIDSQEELVETLDKAVAVIGQYADAREATVQQQIEELVTNGLCAVFGEDMQFLVQQKIVGKRTDIKFKIVSLYDGVRVETDILSARGGGVAAITGFLLRVIMVLLTDSPRILILDEVFAQVSTSFLDNVAQLLTDLADEYGFQFILVTHRAEAIEEVSDSVLQASSKDGKTSYKEM